MRNGLKSGSSQLSQKLALHYHGIHTQQDRDARVAAKAAGIERKFWHMIRIRVPLGTLTADQYLALDALAERVSYNRSLRVTAGQSIQLHGLAASDLTGAIEEITQAGLAAGCHQNGFEYAIAAPPIPLKKASYIKVRALAAELCDEFYPKPGAPALDDRPDHAPRKFTIGLAMPEDNSVNIFAHDLGLLMLEKGGASLVNLFVGGSLSMPGRRPGTYARLGSPLGSLAPARSVEAVKAVSTVFAKHGHLATRRYTRLKYVVDELGLDRFRTEVEEQLGFRLSQTAPWSELQNPSWRGANDQMGGRFFYGLGVPYGRIQDSGVRRHKTAVRTIVEAFRPTIVLAPDQNIILAGLTFEQMGALERILAGYHIPFGDGLTKLRFEAMACAGLPTCPLAVAESERVAGGILDELEALLTQIGKRESTFNFRISGCSIGCIRPNMVDLGAIGRRPGQYDLFVGGSETAGRFSELYAENVPLAEIVSTIRPLLEWWGRQSEPNETFGDFYARWFANGEKPNRLVLCEAVPARERVERRIQGAQEEARPSGAVDFVFQERSNGSIEAIRKI